jgi:hypothetical protein
MLNSSGRSGSGSGSGSEEPSHCWAFAAASAELGVDAVRGVGAADTGEAFAVRGEAGIIESAASESGFGIDIEETSSRAVSIAETSARACTTSNSFSGIVPRRNPELPVEAAEAHIVPEFIPEFTGCCMLQAGRVLHVPVCDPSALLTFRLRSRTAG